MKPVKGKASVFPLKHGDSAFIGRKALRWKGVGPEAVIPVISLSVHFAVPKSEVELR